MQGEWNKNTLEHLFQTNAKAVERAIILLHDRQTADERARQATAHHNSRGFNGTDAPILSSFADRIRSGRSLTDRQLAVVRKARRGGFSMLAKYHRQILEEITHKEMRQAA